jgi:hypothetical protein
MPGADTCFDNFSFFFRRFLFEQSLFRSHLLFELISGIWVAENIAPFYLPHRRRNFLERFASGRWCCRRMLKQKLLCKTFSLFFRHGNFLIVPKINLFSA